MYGAPRPDGNEHVFATFPRIANPTPAECWLRLVDPGLSDSETNHVKQRRPLVESCQPHAATIETFIATPAAHARTSVVIPRHATPLTMG
jgi:hypothetical protein